MFVTSQKRLVAISHVTTPDRMGTTRSHGAVYSWIVTVLTEHLSTDLDHKLIQSIPHGDQIRSG